MTLMGRSPLTPKSINLFMFLMYLSFISNRIYEFRVISVDRSLSNEEYATLRYGGEKLEFKSMNSIMNSTTTKTNKAFPCIMYIKHNINFFSTRELSHSQQHTVHPALVLCFFFFFFLFSFSFFKMYHRFRFVVFLVRPNRSRLGAGVHMCMCARMPNGTIHIRICVKLHGMSALY